MSSGDKTPKVSIILVNWNGWRDSVPCLDSVFQIAYPNYDVILVDNNSDDESVEKISAYAAGTLVSGMNHFERRSETAQVTSVRYSRSLAELGGDREKEASLSTLPSNRRLRIILNDENYGYSDANNVAITYAREALNPDYILLLNNDTIVHKLFLNELVAAAEHDETIGMAGPKIYYCDFEGRHDVISFTGGRIDMTRGLVSFLNEHEIDQGQYDSIGEFDSLSGACLLVKKELLDRVGLLRTDYFLYWEDFDWCFRARRLGYGLAYVPSAIVWHKVSATTSKIEGKKIYYWARGLVYFIKRFATMAQLVTFFLYFFCYGFWFIPRLYLQLGTISELKEFYKGIADGLFTRAR
ncbi:MAG: glycosyltransferase family 2 protein [Halobacteriota archaeon]